MGIFDFIAKKQNPLSNPTVVSRPLIVIDCDTLQWTGVSFLEGIENPNILVFLSGNEIPFEEELSAFPLKSVTVPTRGTSGTYLSAVLACEILDQKPNRILLVTGNQKLQGFVDFCKERQIDCEMVLSPRERKFKMHHFRYRRHRKHPNGEAVTDNSPNPTPEVSNQPESSASNASDTREVAFEKIVKWFNTRYEIGKTYSKGQFGLIPRQATGKTVEELFGMKTAKPFIDGLAKAGILEMISPQQYQVLEWLSTSVLETIANQPKPTYRRRRYRFQKRRFRNYTNQETNQEISIDSNTDTQNHASNQTESSD
ncbi:MAG: hypothetical protein NZ108_04970 [Bacteroidia bacterium]|nr:hypothetical protein [Bacteroidia bacterium]